jgi:LmbE family N-acetylglucosaminyl deacetylase
MYNRYTRGSKYKRDETLFPSFGSVRLHVKLILFFILLCSPITTTTTTTAQIRNHHDQGATGLGLLLQRLQTIASAMHIGAHPDDEDSALITRLAHGDNARVAYLSLNRGEGGQNLIGPELFEALGVIRTEELLQARKLDGCDQLFTRVIDFGFTKTRAEASTKWGEQQILEDMVRAVRKYRPLVIISRFKGAESDGHGQHQLAGYLTPIAFRLASDPNQFPQQIKEGLKPWKAKKLYVNGTNDGTNTLRVNTGTYDPLLGRTYFELAMQGRSQHKSQEMGTLELHGPQTSNLISLEDVTVSDEKNIFAGMDTSISGIAQIAGIQNEAFNATLSKVQQEAARSLSEYNVFAPEKIIDPLAKGLRYIRQARNLLLQLPSSEPRYEADFLLAQKESEFSKALQKATGITIDLLSNVETIVPSESFIVRAKIFAPNESITRFENIKLSIPVGWTALTINPSSLDSEDVKEKASHTVYFNVTVPRDALPTQPYWLNDPPNGYLYNWSNSSFNGEPFEPPLITGNINLKIGGELVTITKPVEFRYKDPIRGEIRRNLNVTPLITVAIEPDQLLFSIATINQRQQLSTRITNNSSVKINGIIKPVLPYGWQTIPQQISFTLNGGENQTVIFSLHAPSNVSLGSYKIGVKAYVGEKSFNQTRYKITYPHIQTHYIYRNAEITAQVLDLKVAQIKVGYVMGSGDSVPEAIKRMGLGVTMLDEKELSIGDLSRFDTIVVGIRASQVRPDFVSNNYRLLEFVKNGGTLIVQYQRSDYTERGLTPLPATINAASRVTDETAPVKILKPDHAIFNYPNKITDKDWDGWVQERNLYNFTTYDSSYIPLLESNDIGENPQTGGQVLCKIGRGTYIYTSYAWFRQLPAGVPGAYRIFANLLSLPKENRN